MGGQQKQTSQIDPHQVGGKERARARATLKKDSERGGGREGGGRGGRAEVG